MVRVIASCFVALYLAGASLGAHGEEITVSAAASLGNAFKDIGSAYETRYPGSKVVLNFGASGALLQQIAKGAPVDVLASADQETMDQAVQQHLVQAEARRQFARNSLVVIVPAESASRMPTVLQDLEQARFTRVAIGLPGSVPAGRYAKTALEKARLWPAIEPKMVGASSVRQALDYVARAEADAGFVYATDAALMPDKVKVAFTVATESPVLYPIAPIQGAAHAAEARRFVDFVQSNAAQAILARYGFLKP